MPFYDYETFLLKQRKTYYRTINDFESARDRMKERTSPVIKYLDCKENKSSSFGAYDLFNENSRQYTTATYELYNGLTEHYI